MAKRLPKRLPDDDDAEQPKLNQQIARDHRDRRAERPQRADEQDRQRQKNGQLQPLRPHQKISAVAVIGVAQRQDRRGDCAGANQQRDRERRIVGNGSAGPEREKIRPKR